MRRKVFKTIYLLFVMVCMCTNISFARSRGRGSKEVEEPVSSEQKTNKSEAIVYAGGFERYNPINTKPAGFVQEEYDKVNNFNIDFNTLELRIKYFSPNYINAKTDVINNNIVNSGMRGQDATNVTSKTLDTNNSSLILKKDSLIKTIKNEILNYLAANDKYIRFKEQNELYKRLCALEEQNLKNGLSTALSYNNANLEASNAMQQLDAAKNDMQKYKNSVAKYLGYNLSDVDKLNFVEPSVDIEKIASLNYDEELNKMLISDSNYIKTLVSGDEGSNGSTKLPGSTGQDIYYRKVQMAKDNVEINFEKVFANLINKCRLYVSNIMYLNKIANLKESDNKSKYKSELISEIEYIRNNIDVLKDRADVANSKYDLLKAYNEYYYSTLLYDYE